MAEDLQLISVDHADHRYCSLAVAVQHSHSKRLLFLSLVYPFLLAVFLSWLQLPKLHYVDVEQLGIVIVFL